MKRITVTLADLDPLAVTAYNISSTDLSNIFHYLQAMQSHLEEGTWEEICIGGYYGTSALLHEVVELRILLTRDAYLLTRSHGEIKAFARHANNYGLFIL